MNNSKYLTDAIPESEILSWQKGDNIVITAPTGAGKTTFIKKKLDTVATQNKRKILEFEPRSVLKQSQLISTRDCKSLQITSYQNYKKEIESLEDYYYIVMDECHYPFAESMVNELSHLFFSDVINLQNSVKIWMSATPMELISYFQKKKIPYRQITHNCKGERLVGELLMYNDREDLSQIMDFVLVTGLNAMLVSNNSDILFDIYERHPDKATLMLSDSHSKVKSSSRYREIVKQEKAYIAKNERFSRQLLLATKVMDVGTSLLDWNFQVVIVDGISNPDEIQQIVGRKRARYTGDTVYLYAKNIKNSTLNGYNSSIKKQLKCADYLIENGKEAYKEWFDGDGVKCRDCAKLISTDFKINEMKIHHLEYELALNQEMIELGVNGFQKKIEQVFDIVAHDAKVVNQLEETLKKYCDDKVSWWTKSETKQLAIKLGFKDTHNRILTSYEAINLMLKDKKSQYRIIVKRRKKKVDGKLKTFSSVWSIEKLG